jgi:hypothetical protein
VIRRIAATAALVSLAAAAPAVAAPKADTITAVGGMDVKLNQFITDAQRWDADTYTVKSGATVTLKDKSKMQQPHTLSLVDKLPKTTAQIMGCEACGPLMTAHQVNEQTGEVGVEVVNAGAQGFDAAGDSIYLPPKGSVSFKVTAKKGSKLSFLCAVHPWMAATIKVK